MEYDRTDNFWLFSNYRYTDTPPLRSGHLDPKDAQSVKKNDGRKISYYIISKIKILKKLHKFTFLQK